MTNSKAFQTTIYLLRHGEIATPGILAGRTDVAVSDKGYQQLNLASTKIENALKGEHRKLAYCITSPLQRCKTWAEHYCQSNEIDLEVADDIQEMDFGDWDGLSYQNLWQLGENKEKPTIGDFWQDPWNNAAPNGETMKVFGQRIDSWWQALLARKLAQPTLVVCHGGVIKHLIARILSMPIETAHHLSAIDVPYAGVIKISIYYDEAGGAYPKVCF